MTRTALLLAYGDGRRGGADRAHKFVTVAQRGKHGRPRGMLHAFRGRGSAGQSAASHLEDAIRTISVGLMALAAMMVSFSVARQRAEPRREELHPPSGRALPRVPLNLDAIRSAGL